MTNDKRDNLLAYLLLSFFLMGAVYIIFHTENSFGGADPFAHYKIARWSWKHPILFFDSWGKPVYTTLASPFAQLGMNYVRLFNVLAGTLTAWLSWKLMKKLRLSNNWLVILFVLFTPIYFSLMFAALTEVVFSLVLVLSVYLFFDKKYLLSAIVLSFLPLARTEGIVLLPLFLIAFGIKKQWKPMPFFAFGFLLVSLLGWPFYHHFWWLITTMPYTGARDIYGHGELLHFVRYTKSILGYCIAILGLTGMGLLLFEWIQKDRFKPTQRFYLLLLVPGVYLTFMAAHSFLWWQGLGGSLGLIRVMGSVTPLAAIMAFFGYHYMVRAFAKYKILFPVFSLFLFFWLIRTGATARMDGFKTNATQQVLSKACHYIASNGHKKEKVYYYNPYVVYKLGIDPYNPKLCSSGIPNQRPVSKEIPEHSLIVWDAHFGPNEGNTRLQDLKADQGLTLLKVFKPQHAFTVLGGYSYAVYIFEKK
jgi:hypothetical protein